MGWLIFFLKVFESVLHKYIGCPKKTAPIVWIDYLNEIDLCIPISSVLSWHLVWMQRGKSKMCFNSRRLVRGPWPWPGSSASYVLCVLNTQHNLWKGWPCPELRPNDDLQNVGRLRWWEVSRRILWLTSHQGDVELWELLSNIES